MPKIKGAQLRKLLSRKKEKKYSKVSSNIQTKMKKWYLKSKQNLESNKTSLSLEYRIILKKKILEFLRNSRMNCDNAKTLLYFIDQDKITKKGLKLLGCGSNGCALESCINSSCNDKLVVKMGIIDNTWNYISPTHPNKTEIELYKQMNMFLLDMRSPHYTFFYGSFDCGMDFVDIISDSAEKKKFNKKAREKVYSPYPEKLSISIVELANSDLHTFFEKNHIDMNLWSNILFQICYMLSVTQYYIPGFRHNDFKLDNILVDEYKPKNKFIKYIIFGLTFYIPDIGIRLKMWDLDFGCSDQTKNDKVEDSWSDSFGCNSEHNSIYDLHLAMVMVERYFSRDVEPDVLKYVKDYLYTTDERIIDEVKKKNRHSWSRYSSNGGYKLTGSQNILLEFNRLTGTKIGIKNLVPDDISSPSDLLYDREDEGSIFNKFLEVVPEEHISVTYDSKIIPTEDLFKRSDMFNVF